MNFIQTLMLLLILSTNGIVIPNLAWYCLISWIIIIFLKSIITTIKKNKKTIDNLKKI